jgi:hypothetical protein
MWTTPEMHLAALPTPIGRWAFANCWPSKERGGASRFALKTLLTRPGFNQRAVHADWSSDNRSRGGLFFDARPQWRRVPTKMFRIGTGGSVIAHCRQRMQGDCQGIGSLLPGHERWHPLDLAPTRENGVKMACRVCGDGVQSAIGATAITSRKCRKGPERLFGLDGSIN